MAAQQLFAVFYCERPEGDPVKACVLTCESAAREVVRTHNLRYPGRIYWCEIWETSSRINPEIGKGTDGA